MTNNNTLTTSAKQAPLRGVRVLDLTNVLAGPFCCHQLAHLGADVIKVEVPGSGDLARQLGAAPERSADLMGASFLAQNTGKRSIAINLKNDAGRDVFRRLAKTADVLVENFRPGVMTRLGVGYDALSTLHPALVYCAISGFGQDGPMQHLPAYDQIVQGMSGLMSITGDSNSAPLRTGYPVADTIGGLTAAMAINAALAAPVESRGTFIDVSMLESVIATMGWAVSNWLVAGKLPTPQGNNNFTASPSGTFQTADQPINIAANKQAQFEAVCQVTGLDHLVRDERFARREARLQNRQPLTELLESVLTTRSAAHWVAKLNKAGVPAGPVLNVDEALSLSQVKQRGLVGTFDDPAEPSRQLRYVRTGFMLNGQAPATDLPPPRLNEHHQQILSEIGYTAGEVAELASDGAIELNAGPGEPP